MKKWQKRFKHEQAQAIMELAIFGAVFVFVLGALINKSMSTSYQQNAQIKAMRIALATSYYYSHTFMTASRNNASVIFIEDRLSAGAGKYGSFDRIPIVASGAGTLSRNNYMPVDFNDRDDLGVMDLFINGQHIVLSTSDFATVVAQSAVGGGAGSSALYFYKQVVNHPDMSQSPNITGLIHPAAAAAGETGAVNCMAGVGIFGPLGKPAFGNCLWGWQQVSAGAIDIYNSKNTVLDIDGDLLDETILGVTVNVISTNVTVETNDFEDTVGDDQGEYTVASLNVLDHQIGQIDTSRPAHKGLPQGLTSNISMTTAQRGSLTIDGGYAPPNKSGTVDIMTREIRLNPNRIRAYDNQMGCSSISGDICYVTSTLSTP
ncbi:hypothetical protein ACFL49_02845 [Candidatus Omnitrophota bacterium]